MKLSLKKVLVVMFLYGILSISSAMAEENKNQVSDAWQWDWEQIQHKINVVRLGRDLQPEQWPNGNRMAVLFSFDVDNETNTLSAGGEPDPLMLSFEQYGGRKGLKRVVDLMDRHEIPATFFIPAVSLQITPTMVGTINQSGRHEIAAHGWIHERMNELTREQEFAQHKKTVAYLEKATGQRPMGYRGPFGVYSKNTHSILEELGFLYDSGIGGDDSPAELLINGKPSKLIELPADPNFEDSVLDPFNTFAAGITDPRAMLQSYKDGFDTLYKEGTMMLLILHPHISGLPSRIGIYEELIQYMKQHEGVWFATHRQAAEYVRMKAR